MTTQSPDHREALHQRLDDIYARVEKAELRAEEAEARAEAAERDRAILEDSQRRIARQLHQMTGQRDHYLKAFTALRAKMQAYIHHARGGATMLEEASRLSDVQGYGDEAQQTKQQPQRGTAVANINISKLSDAILNKDDGKPIPKFLHRAMAGAFLLFATLLPLAAHAQGIPNTVQDLYSECREPDTSVIKGTCVAYLAGVADVASIARVTCPNSTYGAAVQAFVNWAEHNPDHWSDGAPVGISAALHEIWPCPTLGEQTGAQ